MNNTNNFTYFQIPQALTSLTRWILWRLETRDGKPTKVPYRVDGKHAKTIDPKDWTDFDTARRAFDPKRYTGLGFVFYKSDGFTGIDLDGCVSNGVISESAMKIIRMLNSYAEISPSGNGVHVIVKGTKNTTKSKLVLNSPELKAIEVYDDARYFTVTGMHIDGTPTTVEYRQAELDTLCAKYFPNEKETPESPPKEGTPPELSDEQIIELCKKHNAEKFVPLFERGDVSLYGFDESRADAALCAIIAFYTRNKEQIERIFSRSALARRAKWIEREDYRERTIHFANDNTRERYSPQERYPLQYLNGNGKAHTETLPTLFKTQPLTSWLTEAKALPPITPLFDTFWLTGELCFLFASTNVGKTILAVQIADAISKGAKIQRFDGTQTPMKVCLFDFELSARQFYKRYSDEHGNIHAFSEKFLRAEIDPNAEIPKGVNFQDYILQEIERTIDENKIEVVIIDNLTTLISNVTESRDALELMRKLRLLKERHNLSLLVLAHTPKRDLTRRITRNDMVGSMHLLNLCDSSFAIGESAKENDFRYLKQIKCRSAEFRYDSENVPTFQIVKHGTFLAFEHIDFCEEREHLQPPTENELSELEQKIIALYQSDPNLSYREIAKRLKTNHTRVRRVIEKSGTSGAS